MSYETDRLAERINDGIDGAQFFIWGAVVLALAASALAAVVGVVCWLFSGDGPFATKDCVTGLSNGGVGPTTTTCIGVGPDIGSWASTVGVFALVLVPLVLAGLLFLSRRSWR